MKHWKDKDGEEFRNSAVCWGRSYAVSDQIDVAKISMRGRFPEKGYGWLDVHEMAVITHGEGVAVAKDGERLKFAKGDVVYIEPNRKWYWDGDFEMIVTCGPAFTPEAHHMEEDL